MRIVEKLQHAYDSIKDIKKALNEKGINANSIPLSFIGDVIRELDSSGGGSGLRITFHDGQKLYWKDKNYHYYEISQTPAATINSVVLWSQAIPVFTDNITELEEEE